MADARQNPKAAVPDFLARPFRCGRSAYDASDCAQRSLARNRQAERQTGQRGAVIGLGWGSSPHCSLVWRDVPSAPICASARPGGRQLARVAKKSLQPGLRNIAIGGAFSMTDLDLL